MTNKEFWKKVFNRVVCYNLLAIIVFMIILWFGSQKWMDWFTHHGEAIEVPSVIGQTVADAQEQLEQLKLEGVVVDSIYDKSKPAHTVLEQKPGAGKFVKGGRQIYLTVNKRAMDKIALPNVIDNCSLQQAQQLLYNNGFTVGNIEYISGDKDMVLGLKSNGVSVRNGQKVSPEIPLTIIVGQDYEEVDEYGMSEEDWEEISNGDDSEYQI